MDKKEKMEIVDEYLCVLRGIVDGKLIKDGETITKSAPSLIDEAIILFQEYGNKGDIVLQPSQATTMYDKDKK